VSLAKRKTPTKAQRSYHDAVIGLGCVVCLHRGQAQPNRTTLHHRNLGDLHGQKQLGQDSVVAMCAWHHLGDCLPGMNAESMRDEYGPSFDKHAKDFRNWTDDVLPNYPGRGTERWQAFQDEQLDYPATAGQLTWRV